MDSSINSDLIRGHIDSIILHTLETSDKSTQQISDEVAFSSNNKYELNQATLYSSLKRLESIKLVHSYWQDADNGRRKFFSLTEKGKEIVKQKLEDWSNSRNILDSLMGCKPETIKYIKVDNVAENSAINSLESVKIDYSYSPNDFPKEFSTENKENAENVENNEKIIEDEHKKDLNYKGILSKILIENTKNYQPESLENNESNNESIENNVQKDENEQKVEEIAKLNDTLVNSVDKNFNKDKIDFADITLKAAKEGFKLKISTKEKINHKKGLLINKLNFFSMLFASLLFILETVVLIKLFSLDDINLIYCVALIFPIIFTIIYLKNPSKVIKKQAGKDSIAISILASFNTILVIVALNYLILGGDFLHKNIFFTSVIFPSLLMINVFLFFLFRYKLSENKNYNITK